MNFIGFKTHDEDIFESSKNKKIVMSIITGIKRTIVCSMFLFSIYIAYNRMTSASKNVQRMTELYPRNFDPKFPFDDLDDMISLSKKCMPMHSYSPAAHELITIRQTKEEWVVMNLTLLYEYLEEMVMRHESDGMYSYCSTMLGVENIPCACATKMEDGKIHWIDSIIGAEKFLDMEHVPIALIKEVSYLFSGMDDIVIHKYVPKSLVIGYVECHPLYTEFCKIMTHRIQGQDVFVLSRTAYFLGMDPKIYTNIYPHFGSLNVLTKDPVVKK